MDLAQIMEMSKPATYVCKMCTAVYMSMCGCMCGYFIQAEWPTHQWGLHLIK